MNLVAGVQGSYLPLEVTISLDISNFGVLPVHCAPVPR